MRRNSIKNWPDEDQPRKKLLSRGAHALSDSELLAILLNNGGVAEQSALDLSRNILKLAGHNLHRLSMLSVKEMMKQKIRGFGEAKAIVIVAALQLGIRRAAAARPVKQIRNSSDIATYFCAHLGYRKQEIFAVVFLNSGNSVIEIEHISEGGLTTTVADPRIILKKALEHNATAIVLCHNHPSGHLSPSKADELLTKKISAAAAYFDIRILDHLIVNHETYFSFADEGLL